jgi:DNA-directed RNA polymerase
VESYTELLNNAKQRNDMSSMKPVQREFLRWFPALTARIELEQSLILSGEKAHDRMNYGPLLILLPASKISIITMHTVINTVLGAGNTGSPFTGITSDIGEAFRAEVGVQRILYDQQQSGVDVDSKTSASASLPPKTYKDSVITELYNSTKGKGSVSTIIRRAEKLLDDDDYKWTSELRIKLGALLTKLLLETAVDDAGCSSFVYEKRRTGMKKITGVLRCSTSLYKSMIDNKLDHGINVRHLPMLVKPKPWTGPFDGGYLVNDVSIMRTHGCKQQTAALNNAHLDHVYDGLNALANTPWRINGTILDLQKEAWDRGMTVGGIPSREDVAVMDMPKADIPAFAKLEDGKPDRDDPDYEANLKHLNDYIAVRRLWKKQVQKNAELHSLRCDTLIKLSQAEQFKDNEIFFGWNLDFRGRAYPIPPNLNHLGSDFCRGLLMFSNKLPLTERGFYWLKVNIANLYGMNKISMDERAQFADDNYDDILKSVKDPLNHLWWSEGDEPWQILASCIELVNAVESGDPASYESSLFVTQDGSCNGLQHYAALGRDIEGGSAVNLVPGERPADVYTEVMNKVIEKVRAEAVKDLGPDATTVEAKKNASARLIQNHIDRKVVKQTVMTSVYGVTFIGARNQIQARLLEKFEESHGAAAIEDADFEKSIYDSATYLATITMEALNDLFGGARATMTFLTECAALVASQSQPVTWITPLKLPCVQPYRKNKEKIVNTVLQQVCLTDDQSDLPISLNKQKSAFPPNYVHSLDSTHMLMTAIEMHSRGLDFSAVHDSYWAHPQNIDEMNVILREKFVDLYSQPLLENLRRDLVERFPAVTFPPVPKTGELDLEKVKESTYFFQ